MKDEEVIASLKKIVSRENITSGHLTGIGAVNCVRLGYYDLATKGYYQKEFMDNFELLNITGNIAYFEGKPMLHCHVTIADHNLNVFGGHLDEAKVSVTVEIFLTETDAKIERKMDENFKLALMEF